MTWRTVVIESACKLSYKNDYLIMRNENVKMVHLSEINTIIIDSTAVTITSYLISEMLSRKIKIIYCDHKRNPIGEVVPYYGSHDSSKKIHLQVNWDYEYAKKVWTEIIKRKIFHQAQLLEYYDIETSHMLYDYYKEVKLFDETNREGHAAKVYFNSLFGKEFNRDEKNDINIALNYGYTVILSQFNKEIVSNGYITQIGIKHSNYFNPFNLSSDLMEPFRPLVDKIVKDNYGVVFGGTMKIQLLDVLNNKVMIKGKKQYVSNAIDIYVKSIFKAIEKCDISLIEFFEYEL
jgi:CRISPR-associated endonuclease Cas1 subtype II